MTDYQPSPESGHAATAELGPLDDPREPSIVCDGVCHYFGDGEARKQVLFDNRLEIRPGEIVIMTGPSGSGKTTLLTLIGTLRSVQQGSLKIMGKELNGISQEDNIKLRKRIGFIFQAHNLFESLTAFQNVKMACDLVGMDSGETSERIIQLLARLGLGQRVHYKPASLSGGQKQRVAIARGLIHHPELILADEPTAALDEKSGREVVTIFQELAREENRTILMVTHDNRILDVADRIVNMVDGRIASNVLVRESALICDALKDFPVFANLTPRTLSEVADGMQVVQFNAGDVIIRQGDVGDLFYVIRDGQVEVSVAQDGERRVVTSLGPKAYFGEVALLENQPRNATVTAVSKVTCYTLSKEKFQEVIAKSATFEEELRRALFDRN